MSEEAPAVVGLAALAVDCADPSGLAGWWRRLLGGSVEERAPQELERPPDGNEWREAGEHDGLAAQRLPDVPGERHDRRPNVSRRRGPVLRVRPLGAHVFRRRHERAPGRTRRERIPAVFAMLDDGGG